MTHEARKQVEADIATLYGVLEEFDRGGGYSEPGWDALDRIEQQVKASSTEAVSRARR